MRPLATVSDLRHDPGASRPDGCRGRHWGQVFCPEDPR